jgi:tetratricopeptide (TPR) repeat protein
MVCAHDSAVAGIRVTSVRPKMIKLHGDFLYDSIKNTIRETETLDKNMKDKFMQFAREYGLVVIGYGGNDRSIMDILDAMLESDGYFPNGLYWCKRDGGKVSKRLNRLMRRENAYWVEIEGFDEFMAELHDDLGLRLPDSVRDPYKATTERLNGFISPMKEIKHPIIKKNIAELEERIKGFEQVISGKAPIEEFDRLVPYRLLGDLELLSYNYGDALNHYKKALIQNPDDLNVMDNMVWSYRRTEKFVDAFEMSETMINKAPDNFIGYRNKGQSLVYLCNIKDSIICYTDALDYTTEESNERASVLSERSAAFLIADNYEAALSDAEEALQITPKNYTLSINKCIALKKLDQGEEAEKILQNILPEIEDKYLRACAFAVLDDKEEMLKELEAAIDKDNGRRVDAKFDPEFTDYREDPDFRKLVMGNDVIAK